VARRPPMELEAGSPSVDRRGSRGRRRASDGGACPAGGAWACACRDGRRVACVEADRSRDVGAHVIEGTGTDGGKGS
jgi:hypothetical protein